MFLFLAKLLYGPESLTQIKSDELLVCSIFSSLIQELPKIIANLPYLFRIDISVFVILIALRGFHNNNLPLN